MKPILFHLGSFPIHSFGVLVGLGFILGLWLAGRHARRSQVNPETIADLGPWIIFGGIVGARIWYVVSYWDRDFAGQPFSEVFRVWQGGLVFYGGLLGAMLTAITFIQWKNLSLPEIADCLAPSIPLGHVFGRLGCLMNGCCYGSTSSLPWAIHFPTNHPSAGAGIHPVQLYESALNLALCALLTWWFPRRRFKGQVFALYLLAYALVRSITEIFRGDYAELAPNRHSWLTPGQWMSFVIVGAGIGFWIWFRSQAKPQTKPHSLAKGLNR